MKPTIESLRKVAETLTSPHELSMLRDNVLFYIAGAKAAALKLGRSVNDMEDLLDKARAAEEFITWRIKDLVR